MDMQEREIDTADLVRRPEQEPDSTAGLRDGEEVANPAQENLQSSDDRVATEGQPEDDGAALLFAPDERISFEHQWTDVQTRFVDDPRDAVTSADHLVAQVMQTLAGRFADHRSSLEQQWGSGGQADTEQLRQAMQRYRTFLHRLLAA